MILDGYKERFIIMQNYFALVDINCKWYVILMEWVKYIYQLGNFHLTHEKFCCRHNNIN